MARLSPEYVEKAAELLGVSRDVVVSLLAKAERMRRGKRVELSRDERRLAVAAMYLENPFGFMVDVGKKAVGMVDPFRGRGDIPGVDEPAARKFVLGVIGEVEHVLRGGRRVARVRARIPRAQRRLTEYLFAAGVPREQLPDVLNVYAGIAKTLADMGILGDTGLAERLEDAAYNLLAEQGPDTVRAAYSLLREAEETIRAAAERALGRLTGRGGEAGLALPRASSDNELLDHIDRLMGTYTRIAAAITSKILKDFSLAAVNKQRLEFIRRALATALASLPVVQKLLGKKGVPAERVVKTLAGIDAFLGQLRLLVREIAEKAAKEAKAFSELLGGEAGARYAEYSEKLRTARGVYTVLDVLEELRRHHEAVAGPYLSMSADELKAVIENGVRVASRLKELLKKLPPGLLAEGAVKLLNKLEEIQERKAGSINEIVFTVNKLEEIYRMLLQEARAEKEEKQEEREETTGETGREEEGEKGAEQGRGSTGRRRRGPRIGTDVKKLADYLWQNMPGRARERWSYIQVFNLARTIARLAREAGVDPFAVDWLHEIDWEAGYQAARQKARELLLARGSGAGLAEARAFEEEIRRWEELAERGEVYAVPYWLREEETGMGGGWWVPA